jgi:hypothetical protein
MKALKIFLIWSGAIWWLLLLSIAGYLIFGGFFYAKSAPLFDALVCAESQGLYTPLESGEGTYRPASCARGIYRFRGSATDIAVVNSDQKYLYAAVSMPEDGEPEKMLTFWLSRGADINIQSTMTGATLLELFAKDGDTDTVALLLKHGARKDIRNKAGQNPIEAVRWYADKLGKKPDEEIVRLLAG